jgi:hypothetical protein
MQLIPDHSGGAIIEPATLERSTHQKPGVVPTIGTWVFHPFLLAAYPIVALLGQNAREVRLESVTRLLGLVLLATLGAWLLLSWLVKDVRKAGILASLFVVLFFTIDMTLDTTNAVLSALSWVWVPQTITLPVFVVAAVEAALVAYAAYSLNTRIGDGRRLTLFLNIFAAVLIAIPVSEVVMVKSPSSGRPPHVPTPYALAPPPASANLPDIYYIILDGYARSDVMKSFFDFDNQPFLGRLEQRGFYVAARSIANYCQTPLSLSASLNGVYLDDLVKGLGADQTELSDLIGKNNVVASLKPLGYKFVTFATGFDPTEHPQADIYLSPHPFASGFERMVLDITPLQRIWPNPRRQDAVAMSRERTFFLLDHLPDVTLDPRPTFTLAHVFCPHPPIIFGAEGEDVHLKYVSYTLQGGDRTLGRLRNPEEFARGYRNQSAFITARIERTIEQILARSTAPPIIILQSDHGSELKLDMTDLNNTDVKERMSILNAFYFPDRKYEGLYPGISPVNSFRVVLNTYFGAHLPLLRDRSFFSTWAEPYRFIDVTDAVREPDPVAISAKRRP